MFSFWNCQWKFYSWIVIIDQCCWNENKTFENCLFIWCFTGSQLCLKKREQVYSKRTPVTVLRRQYCVRLPFVNSLIQVYHPIGCILNCLFLPNVDLSFCFLGPPFSCHQFGQILCLQTRCWCKQHLSSCQFTYNPPPYVDWTECAFNSITKLHV